MTHIERALVIIDQLARRRQPDGLIPAISNLDLMREMQAPESHGVAFGQANSLLDIASLDAGLPLIGYLVAFERGNQCSGVWASWKCAMPFITLAARFKAWTDEDLKLLREKVRERPGRVDAIWHEMGDQSDKLLLQAVNIAQEVFATYADRVLPINGVAADTIQ